MTREQVVVMLYETISTHLHYTHPPLPAHPRFWEIHAKTLNLLESY